MLLGSSRGLALYFWCSLCCRVWRGSSLAGGDACPECGASGYELVEWQALRESVNGWLPVPVEGRRYRRDAEVG